MNEIAPQCALLGILLNHIVYMFLEDPVEVRRYAAGIYSSIGHGRERV
jgi:hypothetical protein